jgi:hypothetical protein
LTVPNATPGRALLSDTIGRDDPAGIVAAVLQGIMLGFGFRIPGARAVIFSGRRIGAASFVRKRNLAAIVSGRLALPQRLVARFLGAFPLADTVTGVAAFVAPIIIHRDRIDRCRKSMPGSTQKRGGNQKAAKRRYGLHL